jgi:hypothetical protein
MSTRPTGDQQSSERLPEGEPFIAYGHGRVPRDLGEREGHLHGPGVEVLLWILDAAAAGVLGNMSYDALKMTIVRMRTAHRLFIVAHRSTPVPRTDQDRVTPPTMELRDDLVMLATDALRRFQARNPPFGTGILSEVEVTLSVRGTWKVYIREVGSTSGTTVELDVRVPLDTAAVDEASDKFVVAIWP